MDEIGLQPGADWSGGRFLLSLTMACGAVLLAACGDDSTEPETGTTEETTTTTVPETPETAEPAETPETVVLSDDEISRAYITGVVEYYEENGLDTTIEFYISEASPESERKLLLINKTESWEMLYDTLVKYQGDELPLGGVQRDIGPGYPSYDLMQAATEEGVQVDMRGLDPDTGKAGPLRFFAVLRDGLVFDTSYSLLVEDVEASVKEYVDRAIARYDAEGLEAVIDFHNSQDSLDGQFYLFLIGEDDLYLAHPIFPHLIGTDIKDVAGSDGQELGEEIAEATEEGVWVQYLWPHPVSRIELQKVTWAVRHDGLIFASGYYAGAPETGTPAWQDADPREYTVEYVNQAVERYERDGLQSFLNYYNSVASFEGEWYLFATDEQDIYHVHPLLSKLLGTDIKDVVGSDGHRLGEELAAATDEEGVWVEYLWPHPVTLKDTPKVSYAVRRDGMLFASGYYERVEDPQSRTKAYVQQAVDYYDENGLDETITWYNKPESIDGQWNLILLDENDIIVASPTFKNAIGLDMKNFVGSIEGFAEKVSAVTAEEGQWFDYIHPNTRTSETLYAHAWLVRHDGLIFMSRYYDDKPTVSDAP